MHFFQPKIDVKERNKRKVAELDLTGYSGVFKSLFYETYIEALERHAEFRAQKLRELPKDDLFKISDIMNTKFEVEASEEFEIPS